jgi:hypothetical protein
MLKLFFINYSTEEVIFFFGKFRRKSYNWAINSPINATVKQSYSPWISTGMASKKHNYWTLGIKTNNDSVVSFNIAITINTAVQRKLYFS